MRSGRIVAALSCVGIMAACGGGGGSDSLIISSPIEPNTSQLASGAYTNTDAIDPLPSFRAVTLSSSSRFSYRRDVPAGSPGITIVPYIAPGTTVPDDLIPMMYRAAELWTRRIEGILLPDFHYHVELSEDQVLELDLLVGYQQPPCPSDACANHYGDPTLLPSGRNNADRNPVVALNPSFLRDFVRNGQVTIGGFRILAHEFGHALDFTDETNTEDIYHGNCSTGSLMCEGWDRNVPAIPVERDFDGILHHYDLREDTDHKEFGIWADVPGENSDLKYFGVQVTRTLRVARATDIWDLRASDFIGDQVLIEASVEGTRSLGPVAGIGTATWSGDLIAVDTAHFQPVLGDSSLSMDLEDVDSLDASFTDLHRTDETGATHGVSDLAYMLERTGNTWTDSNGAVLASFYAVGGDPGGAVAGTMDDERRNLTGAFGALRDE